MELTNDKGLGEGLIQALSHDEYSKGNADFSATEIIDPPRLVELRNRHAHEMKEEASDLIYRLLGRAVHSLAENAEKYLAGNNPEKRKQAIIGCLDKYIAGKIDSIDLPALLNEAISKADKEEVLEKHGLMLESRFFADVDTSINKVTLSGQIDRYDINTGTIEDYKLTSRYVLIDGAKDEWVKQMNIYAYLLRKNGQSPKNAKIIAVFRDWSKAQALRDQSYPQSQVEVFDIELWEAEVAEQYIRDRLELHLAARLIKDEDFLPVCTAQERWARAPKYAVMKPKKDRACRLLDTEDEARLWIVKNQKKGENMYIQKRDGTSVRCASYCPVSEFCLFKKTFVK